MKKYFGYEEYEINRANLPGILWYLYKDKRYSYFDVKHIESEIKDYVGKEVFLRSQSMAKSEIRGNPNINVNPYIGEGGKKKYKKSHKSRKGKKGKKSRKNKRKTKRH